MTNLEKLDNALLSANAYKEFYNLYKEEEFRYWILSILPEVEDCNNQKQDNPWHIYGVLEHILHSVEEINKQTTSLPDLDRRMLAYIMFYHDIGKPASHVRRYGKSYGREIDSFFNHNKKSAEIARRTLNKFGFNNEEILIMEKLINKHDIFMFIKEKYTPNPYWRVLNEELLKEEIADLNKVGDGKKLLGYLIKVGRADSKAQNPSMTKEPLHLLDSMDKMLTSLNLNI